MEDHNQQIIVKISKDLPQDHSKKLTVTKMRIMIITIKMITKKMILIIKLIIIQIMKPKEPLLGTK